MIRYMNKIQYACKECGAPFVAWPSQRRSFCSRICYAKSLTGVKQNRVYAVAERKRRRVRMLGENNPMWCGGDSDKERRNSQYKTWRIEVFERDDYTCQKCGYRNGKETVRRDLNAHHIVAWIDSIELRYEVENGQTMCVPCHIRQHLGTRRTK